MHQPHRHLEAITAVVASYYTNLLYQPQTPRGLSGELIGTIMFQMCLFKFYTRLCLVWIGLSLSPNTIKGWELLSKWLDQHTWVVMFRWNTGNDSDIVIVFRVERTRWETEFGRFRKNWRICKQGAMTHLRYQHLWPTAFSAGQQTAGDGCHNWVYSRHLFVSHAADGELGAIKGHFICSWRFRLNLYGYSVKVISHFTMAS